MATDCVSAIKACKLRIVRLDTCGNPVVGASSVITSSGFVSVGATAEIEDGQEFLQKNACGDLAINEKDKSILKRVNLDIDFCKVDPDAVEITTGQRLLSESGTVKGFAVSEDVGDCDWSLELWQKVAGAACVSGDQEWLYWAWPWITGGNLGDLTFENAPFTFHVTAYTKKIAADDEWGTDNRGPYAVLPTGAGFEVGEHYGAILTTSQPPDDACGATAYAIPVA